MLTHSDLKSIHAIVDTEKPESYEEAGNRLLEAQEWKGEWIKGKDAGLQVLNAQFHASLNHFDWVSAALLCWGGDTFNPEPRAVKLILNAIDKHKKVLAMGGGAQAKTYTASARFLLRWVMDPWNTLIKLISTSGGHAKSNIYSQFVRLYNASIIPFPGFVRQEYIGMSTNEMHSAISRIAVDDGASGEAALRGFHPIPRDKEHPIFGKRTFSIAILDEAEGIVDVVWTGVDNLASTGNVAVYAATNPIDISSEFAQRAEPLNGGWAGFDKDVDTEWDGREGWKVIRLDPTLSENIQQKRMIHEGFMDYESWLNYEAKGKGNPARDTFGHGCYPTSAIEYQIFSPNIISRLLGDYEFIAPAINWASFDGAYAEGGDRASLTTGKYGQAASWYDPEGKEWMLPTPKWVIQAEQQFEIERVYFEGRPNDILMGDNIISICTQLDIAPEWFVMDMTGNGHGLHSYLRLKYGQILGLEWASEATELRILEEDSKTAAEQFKGMISEMLFAARQWAEFDMLKISPRIQSRRLLQQLGNRKYSWITKALRKAESKKDYKERPPHESPDEADSLIMAPQLIRTRGFDKPAMLPPKPKPKRSLWDGLGREIGAEKTDGGVKWVKV